MMPTLKIAQDEAGLTAAQSREDETSKAGDAAAFDLVTLAPTTLAGVIALLRYAREYEDAGNQWPTNDDDESWQHLLFTHLAEVLPRLIPPLT